MVVKHVLFLYANAHDLNCIDESKQRELEKRKIHLCFQRFRHYREELVQWSEDE